MRVTDEVRDAFLGEVADAVRWWQRYASDEMAGGRQPTELVAEALAGLAHSILVIVDGGTKLSDHGRRVWLTGADGAVVSEGLHEYLPDHLLD